MNLGASRGGAGGCDGARGGARDGGGDAAGGVVRWRGGRASGGEGVGGGRFEADETHCCVWLFLWLFGSGMEVTVSVLEGGRTREGRKRFFPPPG